jgi:hypothetical protein
MNYTLAVLGLVNLVGVTMSYLIHGGTLSQIHAVAEMFLR